MDHLNKLRSKIPTMDSIEPKDVALKTAGAGILVTHLVGMGLVAKNVFEDDSICNVNHDERNVMHLSICLAWFFALAGLSPITKLLNKKAEIIDFVTVVMSILMVVGLYRLTVHIANHPNNVIEEDDKILMGIAIVLAFVQPPLVLVKYGNLVKM